MTNDDIVAMAQEADCQPCEIVSSTGFCYPTEEALTRFANFIRAAALEEAARMAEWCNQNYLEHQTIDRIRGLK